eukprot:jgi/Chlat1/1704/Chrsp127S01928
MFFSGDPAASRRKVDLRGKSKEQDRAAIVEAARLERERRSRLRQETKAATLIQSFYRGRSEVASLRSQARNQWQATYGALGERADSNALALQSPYLPLLLFFMRDDNEDDVQRLAACCRLLLSCSGSDAVTAICAPNSPEMNRQTAAFRLRLLAQRCLSALQHNRLALREQLAAPLPATADWSTVQNIAVALLGGLLAATTSSVGSGVLSHVLRRSALFTTMKALLLVTSQVKRPNIVPAVETVALALTNQYIVAVQAEQGRAYTPASSLSLCFSTQLLTVPTLWNFTTFKAAGPALWSFAVRSLAQGLPSLASALPSQGPQPAGAVLLGNLLEMGTTVLGGPAADLQSAMDFAAVVRSLLPLLPLTAFGMPAAAIDDEDSSATSAFGSLPPPLDPAVVQQLELMVDRALPAKRILLRSLVELILRPGYTVVVQAVLQLCALLHSMLSVSALANVRRRILSTLAYTANLVPLLWHFMKECHLSQSWFVLEDHDNRSHLVSEPGWLLPLAVFCPVYSYMLVTTDDDDFYEKQRQLTLSDVATLVALLKQAAWQLLWKDTAVPSPAAQSLRDAVRSSVTKLMGQLHDYNSTRPFVALEAFHASDINFERFRAETLDDRSRMVLREAPYLIPFHERVLVYQGWVQHDREENRGGPTTVFGLPVAQAVSIRRNFIVEDGFTQLNNLGDRLKAPVRVRFINELGAEEAGVDGGGLFKDFLEGLTKTGFDPQYGLFKATSDQLLYPNPSSHLVMREHLRYFEFLGRVLGKALYEGILVELRFAPFFLSKLRKGYNYLNDLPSLDPELYRSLMFLKHYKGDVSELSLYFTVDNNEFGEHAETELVPNGRDVLVTNENKLHYIHKVADHRLNIQIRQQSAAFLKGFQDLIKPEWIALFGEDELQMLISGSESRVDIEDLKAYVNYSGGYHKDHSVIRHFWDVFASFTSEQQRQVLKFVTACSRPPLLGFKYLEPQFCIHRAGTEDSSDRERLPTSATCMNLLKLPPYKKKDTLRQKLLYAINAGAGFDLS